MNLLEQVQVCDPNQTDLQGTMRALQECLVIKQEPAQWLSNIQLAQ
jgi:hypothetical protein